mgnify:FL=1
MNAEKVLIEMVKRSLKDKSIEIPVYGYCMMPVLKRGDLVEVVRSEFDDLKRGDIVVVIAEGQLHVHRICKKKDGIFYTKPDNLWKVDPWAVTRDQYLGKVNAVVSEPKRNPHKGLFKAIGVAANHFKSYEKFWWNIYVPACLLWKDPQLKVPRIARKLHDWLKNTRYSWLIKPNQQEDDWLFNIQYKKYKMKGVNENGNQVHQRIHHE